MNTPHIVQPKYAFAYSKIPARGDIKLLVIAFACGVVYSNMRMLIKTKLRPLARLHVRAWL
jgi:hypothetical protein